MSRRYLNLIAHDFDNRVYSLRRIDVCKHLFYGDSEIVPRAARVASQKNTRGESAVMDGWKNLPPPAINFQASPSALNSSAVYLFSLLGGESNILYSDARGQSALYNIDQKLVNSFPSPNSSKTPNAISLPITQADSIDPQKTESLYVLDLSHTAKINSCFEVLSCRKNKFSHPHLAVPKEWYWDALPPPPFFRNPETHPHSYSYSYAVIGGSTICISSLEKPIGTYTFDTVRNKWRQAGHWALPFFGKAEYVPELNLWFGLSACNPFSTLCAFDLSAIECAKQPMAQHTWDYLDLSEEELCSPSQLHFLNLGSGKFCVATFFGTMLRNCGSSSYDSDEDTFDKEYAIFTGLEVKLSNDGEGSPQLIKHMSKRFMVGSHNIECVL